MAVILGSQVGSQELQPLAHDFTARSGDHLQTGRYGLLADQIWVELHLVTDGDLQTVHIQGLDACEQAQLAGRSSAQSTERCVPRCGWEGQSWYLSPKHRGKPVGRIDEFAGADSNVGQVGVGRLLNAFPAHR